MKIKEVAERLGYEIAGSGGLENEVQGVYIGDLLSWVMANLAERNLWITIQGHMNVIAVAALSDAGGIILAEGARAEPEMLEKANAEDIAVLYSAKSAYEVAKELMALGM